MSALQFHRVNPAFAYFSLFERGVAKVEEMLAIFASLFCIIHVVTTGDLNLRPTTEHAESNATMTL